MALPALSTQPAADETATPAAQAAREISPGVHEIVFADGAIYRGAFENGLARARGEIVRADGIRARAEIVDGSARLVD